MRSSELGCWPGKWEGREAGLLVKDGTPGKAAQNCAGQWSNPEDPGPSKKADRRHRTGDDHREERESRQNRNPGHGPWGQQDLYNALGKIGKDVTAYTAGEFNG